MSERNNENTAKRPDFIAYSVKETRDGKGFFNRVGAAWEHKDGKGYEIDLDAVPVNGRITLRELRDERMRGYDDEDQDRAAQDAREHDNARSRSRGRAR